MIRSALHAVSLVTSAPADVETDLIILPFVEGEQLLPSVPGLSDATAGAVDRALTSQEIQGKPYEFFLTPVLKGWRATRVALIGAGRASDLNLERIRRVATAAAMAARQRHVARIAFVHRLPAQPQAVQLDEAEAVQAITEGLMLAAFSGDCYKSQDRGGPAPEQMLVVASGGAAALELAVERGRILGESSNMARIFATSPRIS